MLLQNYIFGFSQISFRSTIWIMGHSFIKLSLYLSHIFISNFCNISEAFKRPSKEVAHPGVVNNLDNEDDQKHYTYYQWVCFVLFFQALLCYFPKWMWETWEHGLMNTIVCGLNIGLRSEEEKNQKKGILIDYLIRHLNVSILNYYSTSILTSLEPEYTWISALFINHANDN